MRKNNQRIVALLVSVILLSAFCFCGCSQKQPAELVLSEQSWDYGEVAPDQKPSHEFEIKNEGGQELIIESVYSSCACITLDLSENEIPAGQKVILKATFDPFGYEGDVHKNIIIKSNDPEYPETSLGVSITVLHVPNPDIELSQQTFNLGNITRENAQREDAQRPMIECIIYNKGDDDLIIEEIVVEDIFSHNLIIPLTIAPDNQFQAELFLDTSGLKDGEFRKTMRIISNDPQKEIVFLRIQGKIE